MTLPFEPPFEITTDGFLDGRLQIIQPKLGYRAAIDPIFLANLARPEPGARILDAGAGVGTLSLCLAALSSTPVTIHALEKHTDLHGLLVENIKANRFDDQIRAQCGDLFAPPADFGPFDHIFSNPPFLTALEASASPNPIKQAANVLAQGTLADWIKACLKLLVPKGLISLILRAESLEIATHALAKSCGGITLSPLWPKAGQPAVRIILSARKGVKSPLRLMPGIILHQADGTYTKEAEAILRGGTHENVRSGHQG
jgi:tRNA1(Val) A37 N6-methylase TrmN6